MTDTTLPQDQLPPLPPANDGAPPVPSLELPTVKAPTPPASVNSTPPSPVVSPTDELPKPDEQPLPPSPEEPVIAPPTPAEIPHEAMFPGQPIPEAEQVQLEEKAKVLIASDGGLPPSKATKSKIMQSVLGVLALVLVGAGVFFGQQLVTTGGVGDIRQQAMEEDLSDGSGSSGSLSNNVTGTAGGADDHIPSPKDDTFGDKDDGCFLPGTKITMANGSTKNIEDVMVGDAVLSFNDEKIAQSYQVGAVSSKQRGYYFKVSLENGVVLRLTDNHPVMIKNSSYEGWASLNPSATLAESHMDVKLYAVGDFFLYQDLQWIQVLSIERVDQVSVVHNLDVVVGSHSFFADGVYVHNKLNQSVTECASKNEGATCGLKPDGTGGGTCQGGICVVNSGGSSSNMGCSAEGQTCGKGNTGRCIVDTIGEDGKGTPIPGGYNCQIDGYVHTCFSDNDCKSGGSCHCLGGDACTGSRCEYVGDGTNTGSPGSTVTVEASCGKQGRAWCTNMTGNGNTCCSPGYECCENSDGCCKPGSNVPSDEPPDETPPPTQPPGETLSCVGMTSVPATPKLGDSVRYTCTGESSPQDIDHFMFQYKIGTAPYVNFAEDTKGSGQSTPLLIANPGTYKVRCRACKSVDNTNCSPWQTL